MTKQAHVLRLFSISFLELYLYWKGILEPEISLFSLCFASLFQVRLSYCQMYSYNMHC